MWMGELLERMGCTVERPTRRVLRVVRPAEITPEAPYELVERMRASIVVLGPLLASEGRARVSLPGGDDFGSRPIDMHLKGLEALGARITMRHGYIEAEATVLTGARIVLEYPSVGRHRERAHGGGAGQGHHGHRQRRPGARDLGPGLVPQPDGRQHPRRRHVDHHHRGRRARRARAASTTPWCPTASRPPPTCRPWPWPAARSPSPAPGPTTWTCFTRKLGEMGVRISPDADGLWARWRRERLRAVDVATLPYPGVATDYKPFLTTMLAVADGVGIVTENIFKGRFRYVDELIRMGADIRTDDHHAIVRGVERLSGAPVRAHDIRAGAALVIAGLRADGETIVHDAHHIARGYEDLPATLRSLGADVELLD